jgi:hypothetical protein
LDWIDFVIAHYGNIGCGVFKGEFLAKKQHTQRKLLNFENWSNDELSKIELHFIKKMVLSKNVNNRTCVP